MSIKSPSFLEGFKCSIDSFKQCTVTDQSYKLYCVSAETELSSCPHPVKSLIVSI